jgi:hypothetical protein
MRYVIRQGQKMTDHGRKRVKKLFDIGSTYIVIPADGPGEIVRNGDYKHLITDTVDASRLENSTGED